MARASACTGSSATFSFQSPLTRTTPLAIMMHIVNTIAYSWYDLCCERYSYCDLYHEPYSYYDLYLINSMMITSPISIWMPGLWPKEGAILPPRGLAGQLLLAARVEGAPLRELRHSRHHMAPATRLQEAERIGQGP